MAWDEWEHLKSAAAEQHTAHIQLDELQADGREGDPPKSRASGAGTLKHSAGPWTRAAKTADDLESSTARSRTDVHSARGGIPILEPEADLPTISHDDLHSPPTDRHRQRVLGLLHPDPDRHWHTRGLARHSATASHRRRNLPPQADHLTRGT